MQVVQVLWYHPVLNVKVVVAAFNQEKAPELVVQLRQGQGDIQ